MGKMMSNHRVEWGILLYTFRITPKISGHNTVGDVLTSAMFSNVLFLSRLQLNCQAQQLQLKCSAKTI